MPTKIYKLIPLIFIICLSLISIKILTVKNGLNQNQIIQIGIHHMTKDNILLADESAHFDQIIRLSKSPPSLNPQVSTLPGYHILIAAAVKILDNASPFFIRISGFILNLMVIPAIYLVVKTLHPSSWHERWIQIIFFPLIFPFYPLLYTDLFSLSLVLFTFYFVLSRKYHIAGLLGVISLAVRQTNVIWSLFFIIVSFWQEKRKKEKYLFFLSIPIGLFFLYLYLNQGFVTFSQNEKYFHPIRFTNTGNIYFALFSFFWFFLPLSLKNLYKMKGAIRKLTPVFILIIIMFIYYIFYFASDHPYNQIRHFLRNDILLFFTENTLRKTIFYIFIASSLISIAMTKLIAKPYYFLYPLTIAAFSSSWLIELRYYLVPFVLFLMLRKNESPNLEKAMMIYNLALSSFLFAGTITGIFFI